MTLLSAIAPVEESSVDDYLADQADLTAVERFAQRHEAELLPLQAKYYRDLIPLERPQPGQQYAFEVDLDACTGCKACVAACHSLNGLDDGESWRTVTLLSGGTAARPAQQLVTAACHHCIEPACLAGCPVDAYEKDPITGIVAHLDDQCIGCGYCTLTCPYEVPVFNHARGIVRKCDMCHDRLAAGEAPACVQACPNEAIAITVVDTSAAILRAQAGVVVPAAPPASITTPTTIYLTKKREVEALAADSRIPAGPAQAHTPLAVMLVLTQLAVGAFAIDLAVRLAAGAQRGGPPQFFDPAIALAAGLLALGASVLHLGRPLYCYRAVIGWRHSWLSREVLAFGAFTTLTGVSAALVVIGDPSGGALGSTVAASTLVAGLIGVACSVLIYTTTHRSSWRPLTVSAKFAITTLASGLAAVTWATLVAALAGGRPAPVARSLEIALGVVCTVKLLAEATALGGKGGRPARLMMHELRTMTMWRFAAGVTGGVLCPALLVLSDDRPSWVSVGLATVAVVGVVAGELAERSLFFTTASPPR
ncbi:MAG: DmsC/YnfH family molybdoenzyme membrane anchor subunit [Acidimicrobiales bacterium]